MSKEKKAALARVCYVAKSGKSEVVKDDWFAGDTGATDVFVNAKEGDEAKTWHHVSVTNGKKELLFENHQGEMIVDGTQLLPIGKVAADGHRLLSERCHNRFWPRKHVMCAIRRTSLNINMVVK